MHEIDKTQLGSFIAQLRKEKGFTQKQLAEQLFISDKAVSKWETGASMPDTALLIPLADLLGVTVTELLTYQKIETDTPMDVEQVETILKTAISYTEEEQTRAYQGKNPWIAIYILCLLISCVQMLYTYLNGYSSEYLFITIPLCAGFGCYFCIFAKTKLPAYYDENKIGVFNDGIFRMNVPGVSFNNSNWPHILRAIRIWAVSTITLYPLLNLLMGTLIPELWLYLGLYVTLAIILGGLFIPIYIMGKKYA